MKKTEKIEIRISHEEKERLAAAAEAEGKSISELVRGLASRYVEMNRGARLRSRWGMASLAAIGAALAGGLALGVNVPDSTAGDREAAHQIVVNLADGALDTPYRSVQTLTRDGSGYYVYPLNTAKRPGLTLRVDLNDSALPPDMVKFVLCSVPDTSCEELREWSLLASPGDYASTEIDLDDDLRLSIDLQPL